MESFWCHGCSEQKPNSEYAGNHRCRPCLTKQRADQFNRACPALYRETEESRLPEDQYRAVKGWVLGPQGLLLRGETGTGKSRCAWKLVERLMVVDLKRVQCFDCVGFGHELTRRYRDDDECIEDWLSDLAKCPVLFFDDFGKLKLTERAETELFGLVERRCANKLPIIATTNDTGDSLAARMTDNRGRAMIRRLREFCQVIDF